MADQSEQRPASPPGEAEESFAYIVEDGRARQVAADQAHDTSRAEGSLLWLHMHAPDEQSPAWSILEGDVPEQARTAMIAAETRPRCQPFDTGALLNLRGVGEASMASADPLVSIRLWLTQGRAVSVTPGALDALVALRKTVASGRVTDPGELVAVLATAISKQLDAVIADIGDRLDAVEEALAEDESADQRRETNAIRAQAIAFHRFVAPDRIALQTLADLPCDWLDDQDRADIREAANRFARMTEELDTIRERAALVNEQLAQFGAKVIERRSFILSVVALIFLPLTFFTGLLGINVEGIWYADHPFAFNAVLIICAAMTVVLSLFFVLAHWFRR